MWPLLAVRDAQSLLGMDLTRHWIVTRIVFQACCSIVIAAVVIGTYDTVGAPTKRGLVFVLLETKSCVTPVLHQMW